MLTLLLFTTAAAFCGVLLLNFLYNKRANKRLNLPPRPFTVPFLGSIGLLTPGKKNKDQNQALFDLSSKYGGIFRTKVGRKETYIVTSYELFREATVDKALDFVGRADDFNRLLKVNPHRYGIVAGDGTPNNMAYRKFILVKLRSLGFGQRSMEFCILNECEALIHEIDNGSKLEIRDLLCATASNVIFSVLCSKRYEYDDPKLTAVTRAGTGYIKETAFAPLLMGFPFLSRFTSIVTRLHVHLGVMHEYIRQLIQERLQHVPANAEEPRDFMDIYLIQRRKQLEAGEEETFSIDMLAHTVEDLFLGGFETTATSLQWFFLVMLHFPDYKHRIQLEIDDHCRLRNKNELVTLSDTDYLPLTVATMWEVWRMFPILPFGITHTAHNNAKLGKYDIEAGKDVVYHLWSIQHDPKLWEEPEKFFPERFLSTGAEGKLITKHPDQLVVFSAGRRSCIGEQLARKESFLVFANLMRAFNVERVGDAKLPELKETPGFIMYPPDYEVGFSRRTASGMCSAVANGHVQE